MRAMSMVIRAGLSPYASRRTTGIVIVSSGSLFAAMELSVSNRGCSGMGKGLTAKSLTAAPTCSVF